MVELREQWLNGDWWYQQFHQILISVLTLETSGLINRMILLLLALVATITHQKLAMVQSVFRHGARYPIYPNQYDGTMYAVEEDKVGQLTPSGKRMHYLLGQLMYQEYWQQLGLTDKLNQTFIYVKSTDVNRTIESVQSQLYGMFEKLQPWTLNQTEADLSYPSWTNASEFGLESKEGAVFPGIQSFHSTPIHVQKTGSNRLNEGDFLRMYTTENCPNQKEWQSENQQSPLARSINEIPRMSEAIKEITSFYKFQYNMSLYNISNYVDNYFCSKYLAKPYAPIYEGEYAREYNYINSLSLYINLFFTDLQINSTVSGFLNETRENMMNVMKSSIEEKLIIFSAHDTTVANVLAGLRMVSAECILAEYLGKQHKYPTCISDYPYYASNLILQLHYNNPSYFVKVRYNGQYRPLYICGNKTECPWEEFDRFLIETIRLNYLTDCGVPEFSTTNKALQIGLIVGVCVMGIILLGLAAHILYRSRKNSQKSMKSSLIVRND